ncbi:MAG: cysteine synthase A [Candidatus Omnitrophica bacterium]|nr:cysteine synthase A [Candidatus Omnitrophota bacterium]
MIRLNRIVPQGAAEVLGKLESYNPGGSIKDRIALNMIQEAEREKKIQPGGTLVEPTSGNTGIGLALIGAIKGYRVILTMPESMSMERVGFLERLGAQVVLTPAIDGMMGAVKKAEALTASIPNAFMPQQFKNPANPEIHRRTTAKEILEDTEGRLNAFVAGVGTGGTVTGVGEVLKQNDPSVKVIAVEPESSKMLSGGAAGPHKIQGIGAGFIPEVLNRRVIDEVIPVTDEDAYQMYQRLSREEGISSGISAGAAVFAALRIARQLGPKKRVVVILPDTGERYHNIEQYFMEQV